MGHPRETSLGGSGRAFPSTRWSMIAQAGKGDSPECRRALDELCRLYWKPIYAYVRLSRGVPNEEAKDLTQEFLLEMMEGELLHRYSAERGSFRAYLKGALHLFLLERHRRAGSQKRGGNRAALPLNDEETKFVEEMVSAPDVSPEEAFDQQWANSVIDLAVQGLAEEMERSGKESHFRLFDRYELHPPAEGAPTYAQLAAEFGMKETEVNHALAACRRILRERVREQIRDYVDTDDEVEEEIRRFFKR